MYFVKILKSPRSAYLSSWQKLYLTSKSISSGPAKGSKMKGIALIPGAETVDGGTEMDSVSGVNNALCAGTWNAQCLM